MNHVQEAYLSVDINKYVKNAFTKFRFGISSIAVHSIWYKLHSYSETICPLCTASVENEVHFTLSCSAVNDLREIFIPHKFCFQPSSFRLILLLCTENKNITKNFAVYLYLAFKVKETCSEFNDNFYVNIHLHVKHLIVIETVTGLAWCMTTIWHDLCFPIYISLLLI